MPRGSKTDTAIAIEAAVKVMEEQSEKLDSVVLSNGIRLRCKPVPILTARYVYTAIKKPEPPTVYDEEKGRSEVWEGDPTYQDELVRWQEKVGETSLNVMMILGAKVK